MIKCIIADSIKRVVKGFAEKIELDRVCPGLFEQVCNDNHWEFKLSNYGYNGWEVDWWAEIITDSNTIIVSGCMYYGTAKLTLSNG